MNPTAGHQRRFDDIDLSAHAFWSTTAADREQQFAVLRRHRPVTWQPPAQDGLIDDPDYPGYWAVVRHADIIEVTRRSEVFTSGEGVLLANYPQELLEATQSFLSMDAPRHTKLRRLISAAFTPKQVRLIEDRIRANARAIVAELAAAGSGVDFVEHCASRLPLRTFADLIGVPEDQREQTAQAAADLISAADPDHLAGRNPAEMMFAAQAHLHGVALEMAEARRSRPADDLMTNLVNADVDGAQLTDEEIAAFFVLLSVAGTDTTRQTTSHAFKALTDFPEQREWLVADFDARIGTAIEEFLRWATPIMTFRRTAAADAELAGQQVTAGDRVVMFYPSGNWDTAVFTDPNRFDLTRKPNPHLSFGGGGVHFCLGNQIARTQLRAIFRELLHQLPDLQAGKPEYLVGNFVHAVRKMPCTFSS
jgi:cytochrome P450